jgi:phenylacetate-CoA ligase
VGDTAGMTEIGTIMIFECARQPGGTHIIEDNFIEETIEHDGDAVVPYGERSERVVTSFGRGFIPLIRYRERSRREDSAQQAAGARGRPGGIQGRWDDMKLIRGTNVSPRRQSIVRRCTAVDEFQILLTRRAAGRKSRPGGMKPGARTTGRSCTPPGQDLPDAHGLRFNVGS